MPIEMNSSKILQKHYFKSSLYDICNYMHNVDILNLKKNSPGRHVKWQIVIMVFQLLWIDH